MTTGQHFDLIESEYKDIRQSVVEMLVVILTFELVEYSGQEWIATLVKNECKGVIFTEPIRNTLRDKFSEQHAGYPNEFHARMLKVL